MFNNLQFNDHHSYEVFYSLYIIIDYLLLSLLLRKKKTFKNTSSKEQETKPDLIVTSLIHGLKAKQRNKKPRNRKDLQERKEEVIIQSLLIFQTIYIMIDDLCPLVYLNKETKSSSSAV